jgi:hypothetical protein
MVLPRQNPRVIAQPNGEDILLFNPANGMLRQANASGRLVWSMCDGEHSLDDIVHELTAIYDVDPDTVRKDVLDLISALSTAGFLEENLTTEGGECDEKAVSKARSD